MFKKIIILLILFVVISCKTYEKSICIDYWIDKWNYKHSVYCTKKYNKKNYSLIFIKYDTIVLDLNPKNEAQIYEFK